MGTLTTEESYTPTMHTIPLTDSESRIPRTHSLSHSLSEDSDAGCGVGCFNLLKRKR